MSTFNPVLANAIGNATGKGSSGTVLALHSLGLDGRSFDPLRACISNTWRFISPDLPGHGRAGRMGMPVWEDLVEGMCDAIHSLDLGSVHLLGHSMGGAVAAQVASRLGKEAISLTLVATPARGVPAFTERGLAALSGGMEAVVRTTLQRWFGDHANVIDQAHVAYARECLLGMESQSFADAWSALSQFRGYAGLAGQLPATLCLSGELDVSTPPQMMAGIAEELASFDRSPTGHHVVPGAGHMVVLTHSSAVAAYAEHHWRQSRESFFKRTNA